MTLNLTQALEMGLTAQPDNWQEDVLHVTDLAVAIGETCPRQLQLRLKGADRRLPPPGQQMMFRHGQRIHEDLVTLLEAGLPRDWEIWEVELPVELDDITGRIDCVVNHIPSGDKFIVDFKTIRGRAFNWLEGPKPAHVLQVQSYMVAFEQSTGKSLLKRMFFMLTVKGRTRLNSLQSVTIRTGCLMQLCRRRRLLTARCVLSCSRKLKLRKTRGRIRSS